MYYLLSALILLFVSGVSCKECHVYQIKEVRPEDLRACLIAHGHEWDQRLCLERLGYQFETICK